MNEAKIFHVDDNGLVEGEALGRISVMLIADYRELQEQSQRNLNRAIDAETELRKAEKCDKCKRHTLGIEADGKWCTFCGGKL